MNDYKMEAPALEGLLHETHFFASREIVISRCNISILLLPRTLACALCLILRHLLRFPQDVIPRPISCVAIVCRVVAGGADRRLIDTMALIRASEIGRSNVPIGIDSVDRRVFYVSV